MSYNKSCDCHEFTLGEAEDLVICFEGRRFFEGSEYPGVEITLKDPFYKSTTVLGHYHSGRWKFTNKFSAITFWRYAKAGKWNLNKVINRLLTNYPSTMEMEWSLFKRRFRLEVLNASRKIKTLSL